MADPTVHPLRWISPTGHKTTRDMIDMDEVHIVELIIDQANKVWLNVNGVCVFRAGCVDIASVEDCGDVTVLRDLTPPGG